MSPPSSLHPSLEVIPHICDEVDEGLDWVELFAESRALPQPFVHGPQALACHVAEGQACSFHRVLSPRLSTHLATPHAYEVVGDAFVQPLPMQEGLAAAKPSLRVESCSRAHATQEPAPGFRHLAGEELPERRILFELCGNKNTRYE